MLVEIESVINSRPLTYLYEDEAEEALTPAHLVIGRRLVSPVPIVERSEVEQSHELITGRYRYLQRIIEHYWKRFSKEYLLELHQHHVNVHKGNYDELCKVLVGDVVLIKDDSFKRNFWKKGRVEQLVAGKDGSVRGAVLKVNTSGRNSFIRRPVQKLVPLEVQRDRTIAELSSANRSSASTNAATKSPATDHSEKDMPIVPNEVEKDVSSRGRIRFRTDRYQAS